MTSAQETPEPTTGDPLSFQVVINGSQLSPSRLTIFPGATVEFVNRGPWPAQIVGEGPDGSWGTPEIAAGDQAEQPFSTVGDYPYTNSLETGSQATIAVQQMP